MVRWERAPRAQVEVTLLDATHMRRLNRRSTGRRGLTDVIAYALPQPDGVMHGEVYLCPEAAARNAVTHDVPGGMAEELVRLVVHGTLHVLGYDHPAGPSRIRSSMWRLQERYVRRLLDGGGTR